MNQESNPRKQRAFGTTRLVAIGFFLVILTGAFLLTLPISSATGQWTNFIDALFTSTTSVCVTGLVTVTTATHWSLFGHIIILLLIQLGGLGVICCGMAILMLIGRRMGLKERMLIKESYGLAENIDIRRILKGTFIIEGIGAVLLSIRFVPVYGVLKGTWYSVFHSVSAFCNAGIDIIGENSLCNYATNPIINIVTSLLIILGGIGYVVWWDLIRVLKTKTIKKHGLWKYLTLQSRAAILITAILILSGGILIFIFEYKNPLTIGNLSLFDKLQVSFFQSVTTRTAGFASVPQENLTNATSILSVMLMFIGGSPIGTAGGIKTVTIAILIATAISTVKNRNEITLLNRSISRQAVNKAVAVLSMSFITFFVSTVLLALYALHAVD